MKRIIQIFTGDKGEISSKRVVGVCGAFVLFATLVLNAIHPVDMSGSKEIISAVEWIVILSLGFTSIDKFSK